MTFGGEPLLYPDAVFEIMKTAKELDIQKRQVITNGYFSGNTVKIREVVRQLAECGVNDPTNVRCVSFEPNGDVLGSNVYRNDIMQIISNYEP